MKKFLFDLSIFRRNKVPPTKTLGGSGTVVSGGFIQVTEKDPKFVGQVRYQTYSNILANVSIVAAGTRYFLNLVAKAGWRAEPADKSSRAKELAEIVEKSFGDMETPWHRVIRRAAMYRYYGFSVQEWTSKHTESGEINYLDISPRPQITIERWDTDITGKVFGIIQRVPQTGNEIYLPRSKVIYLVDDTLNDSPEGLGLFRHVVETAQRIRRYEELEGWGYETDLRGVPFGKAPIEELQQAVEAGTITSDRANELLKPLKEFIQNHIKGPKLGLMLDSTTYATEDEAAKPSGQNKWGMELLSAGGTSQEAIANALVRLNNEIARILGVEILMVGSTGRGSLALSKDKSNNLMLLIDSTLTELASAFQQDYLNPMWLLNGWPNELKPTLKTQSVKFRDVEQITRALRDMAQAGAVLSMDDPAIDEIRELLGLSGQSLDSAIRDALLIGENSSDDDEE